MSKHNIYIYICVIGPSNKAPFEGALLFSPTRVCWEQGGTLRSMPKAQHSEHCDLYSHTHNRNKQSKGKHQEVGDSFAPAWKARPTALSIQMAAPKMAPLGNALPAQFFSEIEPNQVQQRFSALLKYQAHSGSIEHTMQVWPQY